MSVLEDHLFSFETVQHRLRQAVKHAMYRRNISRLRLAELSALPRELVDAVLDERLPQGYIDQAFLEGVAFPLELMPNAILKVRLAEDDLRAWRKRLTTGNTGWQHGGGSEHGSGPPPEPTEDECASMVLLEALCEMDAIIEERRGGRRDD